jgi:hypothetical protein
MMVYVNGQDIARLVLGGLEGTGWVQAPVTLDIRPEGYLLGFENWLRGLGLERQDIQGFVLVKGPGSATALRTSHALVNALALALGVTVTAVEKAPDADDTGIVLTLAGQAAHPFAVPLYTRDPNITHTTRDSLKRKIV